MNEDMDWEHIGSASRAENKIPICNLGRGVVTLSGPPSKGDSSSNLESIIVWAREKGSGEIQVV